jgi:hypothetical protein
MEFTTVAEGWLLSGAEVRKSERQKQSPYRREQI